MYQLIFIFTIFAIISVSSSLGIFFISRRQTLERYFSVLDNINEGFYNELAITDLDELTQTASGKKLLEILVFQNNEISSGLKDAWAKPEYRKEMILLAKERERIARARMKMSKVKDIFKDIPFAG